MLFEEIDPRTRDEHEYVLSVEERGRVQVRTLLSEGEEKKRWERTFHPNGAIREERTFTEGNLSTFHLYDGSRNLLEEVRYAEADGAAVTRSRYRYRGPELSSVEVFNGEDESLYRERYAYTKTGLLREIARSYPDGSLQVSTFNFGGGEGLAETRSRQDSAIQIYRYDTLGRLTYLEVWDGASLISSKSWRYQSNEKKPRTIEEYNRQLNLRTTQHLDDSGKLQKEEREGRIQEQVFYIYDDEGRLSEKVITGSTGRVEWKYEYDDEGELLQERLYQRGSLEKLITHRGDDSWYEEIYRAGKVVLRIYYTGGKKTSEQFLIDGKVVSERSYQKE
jgi:YD repeat-containing protein